MDVPMTVHHAIALLDFELASTFLQFIDEQLRACLQLGDSQISD
jgi:hypothetical protein